MKVVPHKLLVNEASNILLDMDLLIDGQAFSFSQTDTTELYRALSGTLKCFSSFKPYEKYTIHSTNHRIDVSAQPTAKAHHLKFSVSINGSFFNETILTATLWTIEQNTYKFIITNLINQGFPELCEPWLSSCIELPKETKFKIGDKVKTVVGPNVKTERLGHVFERTYHFSRNEYLYYLLVNGKRYKKQYFESNLTLAR